MVSILHISDLHIIEGAEWNNMRAALLEEAGERTHDLPDGEKLLVITGDFHNFSDRGYQKAAEFLQELFRAMAVNPAQDVFVVPGNHDVANSDAMNAFFGPGKEWKMRQKAAVSAIKGGDKDYMEWRLESFVPYCEFVRKIGIYPADSKTLPAEAHVRNWRGKLNILHLNTALAADGTAKDNQLADADTATADGTWKPYFENEIPSLAIGHNSFFDLEKKNQQKELEALFYRKNVSAYLCGDQHRTETDRDKQMIRLKSGHKTTPEIPNVVCMKGAPDQSDHYSEFGFYWHEWDEETDEVKLDARSWKRDEDQAEFVSVGNNGSYIMRHAGEKKGQTASTGTASDSAGRTMPGAAKKEEKREKKLKADKETVRDAYFEYLARELGVIQFDGIPTDKTAGAVKAELERIFVPLEFERIMEEEDQDCPSDNMYTIGMVLNAGNRAAILAKPGGGKSTLIRRIALAYAYPKRMHEVDDNLPDEKWFPVYIRCRDLGENLPGGIIDSIFSIINRAELSQYRTAFESLIKEQIEKGQMLLLIDGLDEIANEQKRIQFVDQLYTFVNTYPSVHLLVTSRETGFRAVARKLGSYCRQYTIADLNEIQIHQLSENWHQALIDNPRQAKEDSDNVCDIILQDSRITALARNPLLLTTLLFVRRWLGYLPTKKCQLYQEMIKLLLVSWNAGAHNKMDMDETEPQLAFVAYCMTKAGKQTIGKAELIQCIDEARRARTDLLGYTEIAPAAFIKQVEERSSILIQQGLEEDERGNLEPSYEFSHLSFQEYLTAKAIAENWLPKDDQKRPEEAYLTILKNNFRKVQWWEVIPLTAVLLKSGAKPAMEYLLEICKKKLADTPWDRGRVTDAVEAFHLANCIACEVPLAPEILDPALLTIAKLSYSISNLNVEYLLDSRRVNVFETIYHSEKYGKNLRRVIEDELFRNKECDCISGLFNVWLDMYYRENGKPGPEKIADIICEGSREMHMAGAGLMMQWTFEHLGNLGKKARERMEGSFVRIFGEIYRTLNCEDWPELAAACWCAAWAGYNEADIIPQDYMTKIAKRIIELWAVLNKPYELRRYLSWAVRTNSRYGLKIEKTAALSKAILEHAEHPENEFDKDAAVCLRLMLGEITGKNLDEVKVSRELKKSRFLKDLGDKENEEE
ncbi:MAG TPA: metallophosphoesterase [Candidatus Mediterraneibacter stercorigallinarum]|uniref:Metallophosphoesterase n=1 Tax=Candidatus Mediterraneibacter stercorigallinarum TaxID=2838686 RepID=A0A9D2DAA7_9FIRM|nr:metallophosphoesterase [Candidatus Mediterraneibacter stercorigallinarum]